jgi:Cd2+/Zn2+-exporting ATPase
MAIQSIKVAASCPGVCPPTGRPEQIQVCGRCLQQQLHGRAGIQRIDLRCNGNGDGDVALELEYDPRLITLADIDTEVKRVGFCLTPDRAQMVLGIDGMVSPRSEQVIETVLSKLPGVVASASFASRSLRIEFDRRQCALPEIARRLDEMGFRLRPGGAKPQTAEPPRRIERFKEIWREYHKIILAIIGGAFLLGALIVHKAAGPQWEWLRLALIVPAYLLTGWFTSRDTFKTLWNLQFDIDVLMFAAAVGAASLGHYEEGGLLLFLFAIGGAGEELAMDRARQAIAALAKLAPDTATVRSADGTEKLVRVEDLKLGDLVIVRPFDRVPGDGTVIAGASAVDQSPITGESIPAEKAVGSPVFAGTINGEGLLQVSITKLAAESTLAKIVKMVNEAQTTKSPTQVFTDAVERRYVPIVLIATAALIFLPPLFKVGGWEIWFYRAMAFLTAASPCALAIGTPATVLSGIARAARGGVLVKGGVHLENLGRVTAIAFDKTGTLTRGRADVTDVITLSGKSQEEILTLAAAVEKGSTHPLAKAIVAEAKARECPDLEAANVEQISGKGVAGVVNGARVFVGNHDLPDLQAQRNALAEQGRTTVVMLIDDVPSAIIGLADRPRENAAESLRRLKELGISRTIMLTGDSPQVASAIAKQVGVDDYYAGLLPEDKVAILSRLQTQFGHVAMVGDGVNDAPAMATASVGIAMGGAGTDVAIETADVALMADDLGKLPDAIGLSRFSRRIIKQNLVIALGVISILAPLSALGYAYLGVAVLFHEGSTVVVVLNAMRLLVYRPAQRSAENLRSQI